MAEPLVSNVSDTARWVAVYRAWESARRDALFFDPFADRLAGERGRAIAARAPRQVRTGWPMVVRTRLMDDPVLASVRDGCDRVLDLAAGFDKLLVDPTDCPNADAQPSRDFLPAKTLVS